MTYLTTLCKSVLAAISRRPDSGPVTISPTLLSNFLVFFLNTSRGMKVTAVFSGLVAGASGVGVLLVINTILGGAEVQSYLLWAFIALCLGRLLFGVMSNFLLYYFHQEVIVALTISLCRQILATPLRQLEQLGSHRLLVALTDDLAQITEAIYQVPNLSINLAALVACLAYLAWLSPIVFLVVLMFAIFGLSIHQGLLRAATYQLSLAREHHDELFAYYRAVTHGTKELKLNQRRREVFLTDYLYPQASSLRQTRILGMTMLSFASAWGSFLSYIVIGLLLFWLGSMQNMGREVLTACTLTVLQLLGSVSGIATMIPAISRANVALRKLRSLGLSLGPEAVPAIAGVPADGVEPAARPGDWHIELSGVTHAYEGQQDQGFVLGPVSFDFGAGELIFITGGNGSGKTTLAKLISGLYVPAEGTIRLNDQLVTATTRERYRQQFSAVFSDFFLFKHLFGIDAADLDERGTEHLRRLRLDHKVTITGGSFSTLDLSEGQRKRLALLVAYLEDRPIYVFDEWAADQDMVFRQLFYEEILPALKAAGKTIFVITHDERYFHVADRHIHLEYGRAVTMTESSASRSLSCP